MCRAITLLEDERMAKQSEKIRFSKKRVKYISKQNHLKQSDIADLLDRSLDTVKGIYREEMILPDQLDRLAKEFDVSVEYLKGMLSEKAMVMDDGTKYIAGEKIDEDRVDPEGFVIPHYKYQHFWETMTKKRSVMMDPLIKWMEDSHVLMTASGYIDQDYGECIECIRNNDAWIRQAMTYLIVYSCGPKDEMREYVTEKFKDFWDSSYSDMKNSRSSKQTEIDIYEEDGKDSSKI